MIKAKRLYYFGLLVVLAGAAGLSGCGGKQVLSPQRARVDERVVVTADRNFRYTVNQLYDRLVRSTLVPNGGIVPDSAVRAILDSIVVDSLTGFEADSADFSRDWARVQTFRSRYHAFLYYSYMQQQFGHFTVDSSEVIAFYNNNIDRFQRTEQVEISHIMTSGLGFLSGPDSTYYKNASALVRSEAAHALIDSIYEKLNAGMPFDSAAKAYSQEVGAQIDAGYRGWVERNVYHPPFDSIVFGMTPGTYSAPYSDQDGWHIIKVHDYRPAGPAPITDSTVYAQIEQHLLTGRIRDSAGVLLDSLSRDVKLTVNESLLDSNFYHTTDSLWFGVVNDIDTVYVLAMRSAEEPVKRRLKLWNTTPDQKREVLQFVAMQLCAIQAARRDGIDTLPNIVERRHLLHRETAREKLVTEWWEHTWTPSDSAIEAYYRLHPQQFLVEKPLIVQHVVSEDSAMAIFIRDQARSGVELIELAKQYYPGDSALRVELADLGAIGPNDVAPNFFKAASMLAPGEISDPVKTQYGWHTIRLLRRADSKTLEDARVEIVAKLKEIKRKEGFNAVRDRLYEKYHVKISNVPKSIFLEPIAYRLK